MFRKIIISIAGFAFVFAFFGCRSDEGVTGPVTLNDDQIDDQIIVVEGHVMYGYTGEKVPGAYVEAWDLTQGGPSFWSTTTDYEGWYGIPHGYMKYREWDIIQLKATKYGASGIATFTYNPDVPGIQYIPIPIYFE